MFITSQEVIKSAFLESQSQVYETVLQTALAEQRCGARSLALTGSWRWLLGEVGLPLGTS